MRAFLSATLLLAVSVRLGLSQDSPQFKPPFHFAFGCGEVSEAAIKYFQKHGVIAYGSSSFQGFSIHGVQNNKYSPWTDAQGKKIDDLRVYWTLANRNSGDPQIFGIWHLRFNHYSADGDMKLAPAESGCNTDFRLTFRTSGATVLVLLPVDGAWSYESNGRMEQGYLDGILAELDQRKKSEVKPPEQR